MLVVFVLVACSNEQSLQEYYVDRQDNQHFLSLDIPSQLLLNTMSTVSPKQRESLERIKKVNVLAFPKKDDNAELYAVEKDMLSAILSQDKFENLMTFNQNGKSAKLMYLGEEDDIDEIIVFGSDVDRGFAVARVLGDNMNPQDFVNILSNLEGNIDIEGFEAFSKAFNQR